MVKRSMNIPKSMNLRMIGKYQRVDIRYIFLNINDEIINSH